MFKIGFGFEFGFGFEYGVSGIGHLVWDMVRVLVWIRVQG